MKNNKAVFCNKCRHYSPPGDWGGSHCKVAYVNVRDWDCEYKRWAEPSIKNENNDCKDYIAAGIFSEVNFCKTFIILCFLFSIALTLPFILNYHCIGGR